MSKLYFKYSALNSSKTANLLMTAHNYRSGGRKILLLQSNKNTRDLQGKIVSRVGLEAECLIFNDCTNLETLVLNQDYKPDVVLVDEIQFATIEHIEQLTKIVDEYNITVFTYGLKSTYTEELFPSISKLLVYADKVEEIKQVCTFCEKKAIMNLKIKDGKAIYKGDIISVGDVEKSEEYYLPVCRKHFFKPELERGKT